VNEVDLAALDALLLRDLGNQGPGAAAGRRDNRIDQQAVEVELLDHQIGQAVLSVSEAPAAGPSFGPLQSACRLRRAARR